MDKQEFKNRLESLDDIKIIRFNTGKTFVTSIIHICVIGNLISLGFFFLGIYLDFYIMILIFLFFILFFSIVEVYVMYQDKKIEEEFLLKYGKNY